VSAADPLIALTELLVAVTVLITLWRYIDSPGVGGVESGDGEQQHSDDPRNSDQGTLLDSDIISRSAT